MAITTSSPNNKQYCTLTGTFTGTEITRFYIRINNSSGTSFKWKTKAGQDAWSSETTVTSHSANTAYLITLGMSVTFTRNSLGTYLAGDTWIFDVAPDYRLAPNDTSNSFDITVGQGATADYTFYFKVENMKMLDGDYDVSVSSKSISHFKNKKLPIEYWIALEPDSTITK